MCFKQISFAGLLSLGEFTRDLSPDSDEFAKEFGREEKEHWITRVHFWVSKKLTNMTWENRHVQWEIHLQMVDFPMSCVFCLFDRVRFLIQMIHGMNLETYVCTTQVVINVVFSLIYIDNHKKPFLRAPPSCLIWLVNTVGIPTMEFGI